MFNPRTLIYFIIILTALGSFGAQATSKNDASSDTMIKQDTKRDISIPLRFVKSTSLLAFNDIIQQLLPHRLQSISLTHSPLIDLTGFQGMGFGLPNYIINDIKPDPSTSVGMQQLVQWVNNNIAVFNKSTGTLTTGFPKPGNALWYGFGGACENNNAGLTTIKYDQLAGRWVITQIAYDSPATGSSYQCIAISTSEDATGSYYRYAFELNTTINHARFGLWPDAYYMAFHVIDNNYIGALACAFERNKMLVGEPATMQCKQLNTQPNPVTPVDLDGMLPPALNAPAYFLGLLPPYNLLLSTFYVDFVNPDNTKVDTINLLVKLYAKACPQTNGRACAIQPNTDNLLDVHSDKIMHRFVYRQYLDSASMVATHTIVGPTIKQPPAIRWYELRLLPNANNYVPVVFQQGTLSPNTMHRFIPSIAMDGRKNIALGYSVSSALVYPSIEFATHAYTDPNNAMAIQAMVTGHSAQTQNAEYGNISTMSIDPSDDCTFWHTGEYLKQSGDMNWSTYITKFKLANCT